MQPIQLSDKLLCLIITALMLVLVTRAGRYLKERGLLPGAAPAGQTALIQKGK